MKINMDEHMNDFMNHFVCNVIGPLFAIGRRVDPKNLDMV